jgi:hypothetical protein
MSQAIRPCTEFKPLPSFSRKLDITTSKELMCEVFSFLNFEPLGERDDFLRVVRDVCRLWRKWSFDALKIHLRSRMSLQLRELSHYSARGVDITRVGCYSLRMLSVDKQTASLWNANSFEAFVRNTPHLESFQMNDARPHHTQSMALCCPKLLSLSLQTEYIEEHGEQEQALLELAASCRMMQSLHLNIGDSICNDRDRTEDPSVFSMHLDRIITAMPTLTSLSLYNIDVIGIDTMKAIGASQITRLALSNCYIDSESYNETIHAFAFNHYMQKITHLHFRPAAMDDENDAMSNELLNLVKDLPQLISLTLPDSWFLGDEDVAELADNCPHLTALGLIVQSRASKIRLTEGVYYNLVQNLPSLTRLDLTGRPITGQEAQSLLSKNKRLRVIFQ